MASAPDSPLAGWALVRTTRHRVGPVLAPRQRLWLSVSAGALHLAADVAALPQHSLPLCALALTVRRAHLVLRAAHLRLLVEPETGADLAAWGAALARATGRVFADHYRLGAELARGSFATVHRATRVATGASVAVKLITTAARRAQSATQLAAETRVMAQFGGHPGLMGAREVFHERGAVYIVMDLYRGGSLKELVCERAPYGVAERDAAPIALKLLRALAALHAAGVAHRDVKLENCLVRDGTFPPDDVVLADFGFAIYVAETTPSKRSYAVGTPVYVSPEASRSEAHGTPVDMYALGVLVFRMMTGEYPVEGRDDRETLRAMGGPRPLRVDYQLPAFRDVSPDCVRFLKAALQWDPRKRLSARGALVHPWLARAHAEEEATRGAPTAAAWRVGRSAEATSRKRWKAAAVAVLFLERLRKRVAEREIRREREYATWTADMFAERFKRVSIGKENALAAISDVGRRTSTRLGAVMKMRSNNSGAGKG